MQAVEASMQSEEKQRTNNMSELTVSDGSCSSCQGFWDALDYLESIPGAFVMYAGPLSCMRYSVVGAVTPGDRQRTAYLVLSESDIVLGRTEDCIADAVDEVMETRGITPRLLLIFLSCDALLIGLDADALAHRIEESHPSISVRPMLIEGLAQNASDRFLDSLHQICDEFVGLS